MLFFTMSINGLFVGLVTFSASKYPGSFYRDLIECRDQMPQIRETRVSARNQFIPEEIKFYTKISHLITYWRLRNRYKSYLGLQDGPKNLILIWANKWLDLVLLTYEYRKSGFGNRISRLLNINSNHTALMNEFLGTDCDSLLILEDDGTGSVDEFKIMMTFLEKKKIFLSNPEWFLDISDSFSFEALGVEKLLSAEHKYELDIPDRSQSLYVAKKPFTNTCCALMYSRDFILSFTQDLNRSLRKDLSVGIPIDWILNHFLIINQFAPVVCVHVSPGLVSQGSLRHDN